LGETECMAFWFIKVELQFGSDGVNRKQELGDNEKKRFRQGRCHYGAAGGVRSRGKKQK